MYIFQRIFFSKFVYILNKQPQRRSALRELTSPRPKMAFVLTRLQLQRYFVKTDVIFLRKKNLHSIWKIGTYRRGQANWEYIKWKFQDFYATQILREINFSPLKPQNFQSWPFELLWILNFWECLTFLYKWSFSKYQNSKPSKLLKLQFLTF